MVTRVRMEAEARDRDGVEEALNEAFSLLVGSKYMPRDSEFIEEVLETDIDQDTGAISWKGRRVIRFWASIDEFDTAHSPTVEVEVRIDLGDTGANKTLMVPENELAWKIAISALDESGLITGGQPLSLLDGMNGEVFPEARVGNVPGPMTLRFKPASPQQFTTGPFTSGTNASTLVGYHSNYYPASAGTANVTYTTQGGSPTKDWGPRMTMVIKGKETVFWAGSKDKTIWEAAVEASRREGETIDSSWEIRDPEGNKIHPTAKVSDLTGDKYFLNPPAGTGG